MLSLFLSILFATGHVSAKAPFRRPISTLVSFGDSYTDQVTVRTNGTSWPVYASGYGKFSIMDVAVTGSVCNQSQVNLPFPVMTYQIPQYLNRSSGGRSLNKISTVYSIWIGTNDIGYEGLLVGGQAPGVSLIDVVHCSTLGWLPTLYATGARNFLFQSMIPLHLVPLYATLLNGTATFMYEVVLAGNLFARQNLAILAERYPDATIGYFDSYALFSDMYSNPAAYLNGTDPLNVDSSVYQLAVPAGPRRDSYLWYDPLHPSEQADRIVAREIVKALQSGGQYTTWY